MVGNEPSRLGVRRILVLPARTSRFARSRAGLRSPCTSVRHLVEQTGIVEYDSREARSLSPQSSRCRSGCPNKVAAGLLSEREAGHTPARVDLGVRKHGRGPAQCAASAYPSGRGGTWPDLVPSHSVVPGNSCAGLGGRAHSRTTSSPKGGLGCRRLPHMRARASARLANAGKRTPGVNILGRMLSDNTTEAAGGTSYAGSLLWASWEQKSIKGGGALGRRELWRGRRRRQQRHHGRTPHRRSHGPARSQRSRGSCEPPSPVPPGGEQRGAQLSAHRHYRGALGPTLRPKGADGLGDQRRRMALGVKAFRAELVGRAPSPGRARRRRRQQHSCYSALLHRAAAAGPRSRRHSLRQNGDGQCVHTFRRCALYPPVPGESGRRPIRRPRSEPTPPASPASGSSRRRDIRNLARQCLWTWRAGIKIWSVDQMTTSEDRLNACCASDSPNCRQIGPNLPDIAHNVSSPGHFRSKLSKFGRHRSQPCQSNPISPRFGTL